MEDILKLIRERHSVRRYKQIPIEEETKRKIERYLVALSEESGLDIRLVENAGKVFGSVLLKFAGWKNPPASYFAFIGERTPENEEKCGYYGEKLVLYVQSLGLNTCWVGIFRRAEVRAHTDCDAIITIAVGYGEDNGKERASKKYSQVCSYEGEAPDWFKLGAECALLAPTALNRQAFKIKGEGNKVRITCNNGSFSDMDKGIVKYNFEQGAGKENFEWIE